MRLYNEQDMTDKDYMKRVEDLAKIEQDLDDKHNSGRNVGTNGRKYKKSNKKGKKNKGKKKDGFNKEKDDEKLYEINDIQKLCDIIENSDKSKKKESSGKGKRQK
jgi:hypothetical protein